MSKRKIPKRQKVQPKMYTESDLHRAQAKAAEQGVKSAAKFNVYMTVGAFLKALHEIHGFGNKRLMQVLDRVQQIEFDSLSYTELLDEVKQKTGIDLQEWEITYNEP